MRYFLGMNLLTHDAAFYLLDEQANLVFGVEEEKIAKVRYHPTYSHFAAEYMLERSGIDKRDIVMVGLAGSLKDHEKLFQRHKILYGQEMAKRHEAVIRKEFNYRYNLINSLRLPNAKLAEVPHHLCHALSAFSLSLFPSAAVISIDGNGENETAAIFHATGSDMINKAQILRPHSLGWIWQTITTKWLKLGVKGSEGKTMGLAAYGRPKYKDRFYKGFDTKLGKLPIFVVDWDTGLFTSPAMKELYGWNITIDEILGESLPYDKIPGEYQRDIAATLQESTNEIFLALAGYARRLTGEDNLVICGGVAMNSVANGVVERANIFKHVFIPPNASDNGIGLGAALYCHNCFLKKQQYKVKCKLPYTSCEYTDGEIVQALKKYNLPVNKSSDIVKDAADALTKGSIVGWCQGKLELGARALGNRSILALPYPKEMKDKVNLNVKFREYWRPFAPVIKKEDYNQWFDGNADCQPYMTSSQPFKNGMGDKVVAVMHIDGSGRVQTCSKDDNPRLYSLLSEIEKRTKIPILLNTSFNIKGMPIVCSPEDAILCYLCTKIDVLVFGDYIVKKHEHGSSQASILKVSHASRFLEMTLKPNVPVLFVTDGTEAEKESLEGILNSAFSGENIPYEIKSCQERLDYDSLGERLTQVYLVFNDGEISAGNFGEKIKPKAKLIYPYIKQKKGNCYLLNLKGASFVLSQLFSDKDWEEIAR